MRIKIFFVFLAFFFTTSTTYAQTLNEMYEHRAKLANGDRVVVTLLDADCTDSYDTPAPFGDATVVSNENNWNTFAKAVDIMSNYSSAVQTSGSADGWCDATPWVINGSITMSSNEDLFLGPFRFPGSGVAYRSIFTSLAGSGAYDIIHMTQNSFNTSTTDIASLTTPINDTNASFWFWTPWAITTAGDEPYSVTPVPNQSIYIKLSLTGNTTWVWEMNLELAPATK
jgi:hypothetical protein